MTKYISLPVPEELVPDVMRLIVEKMKGAGAASVTAATAVEEAPSTAGGSLLEPNEAKKLWTDSGARMRAVLAYLAARPDMPISGDELAREALGREDRGHTVAGMMGAMGRRIKHRHQGRWPFVASFNAVAQRWEYMMPGQIAEAFALIIAAEKKEL